MSDPSLGGRPSKYTPELLEKTQYFLDHYRELGREVPSNFALSRYLGIHKDTLYAWQKDEDKQAFSDLLGQIQAEQALVLIDKGLTSEYNSNICKLMLAKHGYHDKQDLTTQGGMSVTIESLDASNL